MVGKYTLYDAIYFNFVEICFMTQVMVYLFECSWGLGGGDVYSDVIG